MSDYLDQLERDLVAAARRRASAPSRVREDATARSRPPRPRGWRSLALAAVTVLVFAASASAALLVLRGSVIPGPASRDVPADQLPVPSSVRIAALRAADPASGQPPWTLRIARSHTGLLCSTVGQFLDGQFGLVGMDGRFRALSPRIVDSCGAAQRNAVSLIGARVLDATRRADVRTVVNGIAGPRVRRVLVTTVAGTRPVAVGAGGAFLVALRGYPEDLGVVVALVFADGHVERHAFATAPGVVRAPGGAGAWQAMTIVDGGRRMCVRVVPVRAAGSVSRQACGLMDPRERHGYFFAVGRLEPGAREHDRGDHPVATAVWGLIGHDVRGIEIIGPHGLRVRPALAPAPGRTVLVVLPADVDPSTLSVRVTFLDGRVVQRRGDTNLVAGKLPGP